MQVEFSYLHTAFSSEGTEGTKWTTIKFKTPDESVLTEKGVFSSDGSISFFVPRFRNARAREVLHKKMAVGGAILQCCFCLISILGDPGAVN